MVKKQKSHPLDVDPPTAASSNEDDEPQTSEEEEGSSSEEDEAQIQAPVKTPSAAAVPVQPTVNAADSDSETGSETETDDSDSETERPISGGSVKAATAVVSSKPKQNEAPAALALPAVKTGKKRSSEGTSRDTKKRAKKVDDEKKTVTSGEDDKKTGENTKKPPFSRIWLEEDEITVLQGMIDFKSEDTNSYYELIKKSISFEVSKNQFMDKIRSLKKYIGAKSPFTKPHDLRIFELSKLIWGPKVIALESAIKSNGVSKKKPDTVKQELVFTNGKKVEEEENVDFVHGSGGESDWFENLIIVRSICGFGIDEHYVKQRWRLVPDETKERMKENWKALQAKEMDFVLKKTEFLNEVTSMITQASKNSRN